MRILMINKVTKVNIFKTQLLENIFVANPENYSHRSIPSGSATHFAVALVSCSVETRSEYLVRLRRGKPSAFGSFYRPVLSSRFVLEAASQKMQSLQTLARPRVKADNIPSSAKTFSPTACDLLLWKMSRRYKY